MVAVWEGVREVLWKVGHGWADKWRLSATEDDVREAPASLRRSARLRASHPAPELLYMARILVVVTMTFFSELEVDTLCGRRATSVE